MKAEIWWCKLKIVCFMKNGNKKGEIKVKYETEVVKIINNEIVMLGWLMHETHRILFPLKTNKSYIETIQIQEKLKNLGLTNYEVENEPNFNYIYKPFKS